MGRGFVWVCVAALTYNHDSIISTTYLQIHLAVNTMKCYSWDYDDIFRQVSSAASSPEL